MSDAYRTDVAPPQAGGVPDAARWGYLVDAATGTRRRAATEAEYRASASVPGGRGTFWGPFGRVSYVAPPEIAYGWCAYCRTFTYHDLDRGPDGTQPGACADCVARWREFPDACPPGRQIAKKGEAR